MGARAMSKWIIRILFFLALGVVTTVGVAWVGTELRDYDTFAYRTVEMETLGWSEYEPIGEMPCASRYRESFGFMSDVFAAHVPREGTEFINAIGVGCFRTILADETAIFGWGQDHVPLAFQMNFDVVLLELRVDAGWPARAIMARVRESVEDAAQDFETHVRFATNPHGGPAAHAGYLPAFQIPRALYRPIFPGFIINTLFYAAMWFGIFFGVAALRRFIRKKRGRCVKCGYDLRYHHIPCGAGGHSSHTECGGTSGCPECGWGRE